MEKLIKLSDAMDAVMWGNGLDGSIVDDICEKLEALPSADRPRGEWIATTMVDCGAPIWLCSMCEYESYGTYNFCPSCGARMKGADDDD